MYLKFFVEMFLYVKIYDLMNVGCSFYVYIIDNNVIFELYGDEGVILFKG